MSTSSTNKLPWILVLLVALTSAMGGYSLWRLVSSNSDTMESLLVLPEPRKISDFVLVDQNGEEFTQANLKDRWSMVFFGFTHCPDVCPGTLYDLQKVSEAIRNEDPALADQFQVVFVSVDPERDTPARLKEYASWFDPAFVSITGQADSLRPLTTELGIAWRIEEHEAGDLNYQVDHSSGILLLNLQGNLHGVFSSQQNTESMTADMLRLLN